MYVNHDKNYVSHVLDKWACEILELLESLSMAAALMQKSVIIVAA